MIFLRRVLLALIGCSVLGTRAVAETIVIDDFETYQDGQILGLSYDSTPWLRFGDATADNVVATNRRGKVISGRITGQYGVYWPNTFGAARYAFANPSDLTPYRLVSVKLRSDEADTRTMVKLAISNGYSTFAARRAEALTDQEQVYTFDLSPDAMIRVDGQDDFDEVVHGATNIGFTFQSPQGQYSETILIDDFQFINEPEDQAAVPSATTAGVVEPDTTGQERVSADDQ